jgi:hypothetical protein
MRGGETIADGRRGRQWSLSLPDRVLGRPNWRTILTMRQLGPLFGASHSAVHRVIDTLGPLLALAPVRKRRADQVTIVDAARIHGACQAPPAKDQLRDVPEDRPFSQSPRNRRQVRRSTSATTDRAAYGDPAVTFVNVSIRTTVTGPC